MSTYRAYFDDSGRDVLAIAGYIAPAEFWDDVFLPEWQRFLAEAPRPIKEYKASDCENRKQSYEDWTPEQSLAFTAKAVDLLTQKSDYNHFFGIGVAVQLPRAENFSGFDSKLPKEKTKARREQFDATFEYCVRLILFETLNLASVLFGETAGKLEIIFDEQALQVGNTWQFFAETCQIIGAGIKRHVPIPEFRPSDEVLPLQAADLLAYETRKEVVNSVPSPRIRPMRKSLAKLVTERVHFGYFADFELVQEFRRRHHLGLPNTDLRPQLLYKSE